ncbi:MAG: dCMP deaminase family protein [Nanoarchaeota archaeon]
MDVLDALDEMKIKKREDYLSWDEYFMGISLLSAQRSKDPNTQVGACVVDSDKKIVGIGYNGFPRGCSDENFPWSREGDYLETKYAYVCHAEINAILNSMGRNLNGSTLYVALFPCNECAKAIIQVGIKKIVYLEDKYANADNVIAAKRMFDSAEVKYETLKFDRKNINLSFGQKQP